MADVTLANAVFPSPVTVPPHGLLYLTSSLEERGHTVALRDYQLHPNDVPSDPTAFADFADSDTETIGISCMSYALPLAIEAAKLLKERRPERNIVLGGIGPSPVATRLLSFCPDLDAVVIGEGEETLADLVDSLSTGRPLDSVKGIAYRDGEQVKMTAPRPRQRSLEDLPWPAYGRVDQSNYRIANMQFGRGCPFHCSFCDIAPYWGRLHTKRSVSNFLDELERLVEVHAAHDVFFVDDTFVLSHRLVEEICDGILQRNLTLAWGCYARTDLVSEELLVKMAAAGCEKIFYGVESGSDIVLQDIDKGVSRDQTERSLLASLKHIPFVTTSFVWGFPGETVADLEETACMLIYFASLGACPQLNLALPYTYSQLFQQHRSELFFSPELSSQLCFYTGADQEWASDLIKQDAELFSAFYQIPTPELTKKWEFLDAAGLNPLRMQEAFFEDSPALPC